jgi:hypothetical protein
MPAFSRLPRLQSDEARIHQSTPQLYRNPIAEISCIPKVVLLHPKQQSMFPGAMKEGKPLAEPRRAEMKRFLWTLGGFCAAAAGLLVLGAKRTPNVEDLDPALEDAQAEDHTTVESEAYRVAS